MDFALGLIEMNEDGWQVLHTLKKAIAEVVLKKMDTKIEVPSAWSLLEHFLFKTEKPILSISDINDENERLQEYQLKSQEEIFDFLSFFHGHGILLFFKEEGLKAYAILSIQWFSDAFSKLIADKEHVIRDCKRRYIEEWNRFNASGNLSDSLVDVLWKEEASFIKHKAALMSYMERLRMLVSIEGESSWYVPCMNHMPFKHEIILKQTMEKSSILCFRFTSFAMFVYYRLIAYCMSFLKWNVQLDKDKNQCLYHTAAIFETKNHTVIVGIINNDIQIQVLRIKNLNPKVSYETGKTIEIALIELTKTFDERKNFLKGYKCLNRFCSTEDLTFIPENELAGVQCICSIEGKHEIDAKWTLFFWQKNDCPRNPCSSEENLDVCASESSTTDDNVQCAYWQKVSLMAAIHKEHGDLLSILLDFIGDGNVLQRWKIYIGSITNRPYSSNRTVVEDFDNLHQIGKLSPGKYDVLLDFFKKSDNRAIEFIKNTQSRLVELRRQDGSFHVETDQGSLDGTKHRSAGMPTYQHNLINTQKQKF
ncbi:uncharacterized protein LOC134241126 [Saccostrea cucullata]|uniref:uncharacterized protein LOC134241126 n=1 Tax=Saccostrea cuccullata TaxID=36930 RepID=UPI002ED27E4E